MRHVLLSSSSFFSTYCKAFSKIRMGTSCQLSLHDNNIYWYEMFWVRVVSLVSLIECFPDTQVAGHLLPLLMYIPPFHQENRTQYVLSMHLSLSRSLQGILKHPGQTLGNLQVKPCETPRDGAMLSQTALLSPDLPTTTTTTTTTTNFLLRSCFEFEFHRLCLFRSILTGEIVKLHIGIGAKSNTKIYTIHKV